MKQIFLSNCVRNEKLRKSLFLNPYPALKFCFLEKNWPGSLLIKKKKKKKKNFVSCLKSQITPKISIQEKCLLWNEMSGWTVYRQSSSQILSRFKKKKATLNPQLDLSLGVPKASSLPLCSLSCWFRGFSRTEKASYHGPRCLSPFPY
jgi:hypothetical protein